MIYRSEQHAVIRAITSGQQGNIKAQAWQQLAESGWPEEETKMPERCERLSAAERLTQDAMTYAKARRELQVRHRLEWLVLVAKYSTDERERDDAIAELAAHLQSPAKKYATTAALIRSCVSEAYRRMIDHHTDTDYGAARSTWRRWRGLIREQLRDLEDAAVSRLHVGLQGYGVGDSG